MPRFKAQGVGNNYLQVIPCMSLTRNQICVDSALKS